MRLRSSAGLPSVEVLVPQRCCQWTPSSSIKERRIPSTCGWQIVISPKILRIPRPATILRCAIWPFFHPFHRRPGSVARSWRRPFPNCGVASPQTPTLDHESLPTTITQFMRVGPDSCWLAGAHGPSSSSVPFRNRTEAFDTARASPSHEQAKVPHAVLTESLSEARPERTERRTHPFGHRK